MCLSVSPCFHFIDNVRFLLNTLLSKVRFTWHHFNAETEIDSIFQFLMREETGKSDCKTVKPVKIICLQLKRRQMIGLGRAISTQLIGGLSRRALSIIIISSGCWKVNYFIWDRQWSYQDIRLVTQWVVQNFITQPCLPCLCC